MGFDPDENDDFFRVNVNDKKSDNLPSYGLISVTPRSDKHLFSGNSSTASSLAAARRRLLFGAEPIEVSVLYIIL